jgi:sugar/nucleoside kinase (ribokinase family)
MNEQFELLTIGDASLDAFIFPTESETLCQLNDKDCLICFSYGDKIPVEELEFSIGGNAANNAVGTRRLGVKNSIVLTLGGDKVGDQIVETLIREGVDVGNVFRVPDKRSDYSLVINYSGERTIFTYKDEINYKFPDSIPETPWIYLTSMGDDFEEIYQKVVDWIKIHPETKLVFNPGSRQLRVGVEKLKSVLSISYIIYINREEAEKLSGQTQSLGKEKDLLKAVSSLGPKYPIITDGPNGSYALFEDKFYKSGVLPVDAFERTGAGDSFGSGCLAALIKGKDITEALIWGTVNSASKIGYIGAQRGLLKEDEITPWLERAKSSNLKVEEI